MHQKNIILSAKCAPQFKKLTAIKKAGITAVELYLSKYILSNTKEIIKVCRKFPFNYAVHGSNDSYEPLKLRKIAQAINAKLIVLHDIYWEDEWKEVVRIFKKVKASICIENISTVYNAAKFMRRYGFGMCLDLEHLQMECGGVFEEEFIRAIRNASHIHLTGYKAGSKLWHTHLHHYPKHSLYMLDLIKKAGYSGFIVSEAKTSLQTYSEFRKLRSFFNSWSKS